MKVGIVVATWRRPKPLRCLLWSLVCQTHEDWQALVIHDGPDPDGETAQAIWEVNDPRIRYVETLEWHQDWGHGSREWGFHMLRDCDALCTTNDDNYHVPVHFARMVDTLEGQRADLVLCAIVQRGCGAGWEAMPTSPEVTRCDACCWMARAELVHATPWHDRSATGDGVYIRELSLKAQKMVILSSVLVCHN